MIDYDTMAEAIFREQALRNAAYRTHQGEPARLPATVATRQRLATLLLSLASWLTPATAPASPATEQRAS